MSHTPSELSDNFYLRGGEDVSEERALPVSGNRRPGNTRQQIITHPSSVSTNLPSAGDDDELGKLVQEMAARLSQADSFEDFVESSRLPSDLHPEVGRLPHPAAGLLDDLRTGGIKQTSCWMG